MKSAFSPSKPQQLLLELLSAAILNREPQRGVFAAITEEDWRSVARISEAQSIEGLVGERILALPHELMPPRLQRFEHSIHLKQIEDFASKQLKTLGYIYMEYERQGLHPVLLKGLTLAHLYPHPRLRSLGDLDIYFPRESAYEQANHWANAQGYATQGDSLYEQVYWCQQIAIEHHCRLSYFGIKRYDERLSAFIQEVSDQERWQFITLEDGMRYRTLPIALNGVYLFLHIIHHFSYLGIGLRQICDWVLFMKHYRDQIDANALLHYAQALDLLRPMKLFALMSVRHLGVAADIYPFELPQDKRSSRLADFILADTFRGGNFGFEHFTGKHFRNIWTRRWYMFWKTAYRSLWASPIAPEHIRPIPLIAIQTRLKLLRHK